MSARRTTIANLEPTGSRNHNGTVPYQVSVQLVPSEWALRFHYDYAQRLQKSIGDADLTRDG
jgi:hypothetical protein